MKKVVIENSKLSGKVLLPPSKSFAHRALICSYLAGEGKVSPLIDSNDMKATTGVLECLKNGDEVLNCIESGSTLRFLIPLVASLGKTATFVGEGRLPQRPIDEYIRLLSSHGVKCESEGGLPLKISGQMQSGVFEISGNISSQYITGLLFALVNLDGDSKIVLTSPLESKPYVDMTVKVLNDYGVEVEETDYGYFVKGNQTFAKRDYIVEGDWSQAAFFLSAATIGADIELLGLNKDSIQGDKAVVDVMKKFGANIEISENSIKCSKNELNGIEIDCTDIPDMVPAIAVTASFAKGTTIIKGAQRLRYKESNRIEAVSSNLIKMGADVTQTEDGMIINGKGYLNGADLLGYNDHRIVMAFAVAGLFANGKTSITDANSIDKSYPTFFEDYNKLGGKANVISSWE